MRHIIILLIALCSALTAVDHSYGVRVNLWYSDGTGFDPFDIDIPYGNPQWVFGYNPTTHQPEPWPLGAGLAVSGGSLVCTVTTPAAPKAYDGTTQRNSPIIIGKEGTVSSGTVVFHLTDDGTSSGTALFPNGPIKSTFQPAVSDSGSLYPMSWAWSNSDKTVTVTVNRAAPTGIIALLSLNLLGAPTAAPNGTTVRAIVVGY